MPGQKSVAGASTELAASSSSRRRVILGVLTGASSDLGVRIEGCSAAAAQNTYDSSQNASSRLPP
jgi:hypothetical protein